MEHKVFLLVLAVVVIMACVLVGMTVMSSQSHLASEWEKPLPKPQEIPEPSTIVLLAAGALIAAIKYFRR